MKKVLSILNKTLTWYFVTSIIFCTAALIKISEKESVQINLSVNTEQRLKRIEEKLGLK